MADAYQHKRKYRKECTVEVNVGNRRLVNASMLINTLLEFVTDIYACVPKGTDCFDVTLPSEDEAKLLVEEDIAIDGERLSFRLLYEDSVVVSFMHLPPYIDDSEIENFLTRKGATLKGEIKHRLIKGTNISDGTRYVRVQFSDEVKSLPYSVGFQTLDGYKYFRIIHNNQIKVCFKCNSPNHEIRSCPETKCYKCHLHGHVAKNCNVSLCSICGLSKFECDCFEEDFTISQKRDDNYDTDFPPIHAARASDKSPADEGNTAREDASDEIDMPDNTGDVDKETKPKQNRRNSSEWQSITSKRIRRSVKLSDSVLKDNDIKNKLRENRKDEMKKKKEIQANEKRAINQKDEKIEQLPE